MFWKNIRSKEYQEINQRLSRLEFAMKDLELDLQLYVKKLRATRGLTKIKEDEEDSKKDVIVPV